MTAREQQATRTAISLRNLFHIVMILELILGLPALSSQLRTTVVPDFSLCVPMLSSSMTQLCLCVCVCMAVLLHSSLGLPAQHHGWLRLWEEDEGCGTCNQRLCPPAPVRCPAGRLKDDCGCCERCANVEGQRCDPDPAQRLYGRCGEGLVCQRKAIKGGRQEPEPTCVCQEQDPVCGSDGWTHQNVCQMREAGVRRNTAIKLSGRGPCSSGYCTLF